MKNNYYFKFDIPGMEEAVLFESESFTGALETIGNSWLREYDLELVRIEWKR